MHIGPLQEGHPFAEQDNPMDIEEQQNSGVILIPKVENEIPDVRTKHYRLKRIFSPVKIIPLFLPRYFTEPLDNLPAVEKYQQILAWFASPSE